MDHVTRSLLRLAFEDLSLAHVMPRGHIVARIGCSTLLGRSALPLTSRNALLCSGLSLTSVKSMRKGQVSLVN